MKKLLATLLLTTFVIIAAVAQHKVTGEITDTNGDPLPFAMVGLKGSTNGIVSNGNGKYSITIPSTISADSAILVFSCIGFNIYETAISGRILIDAVLQESATSLDEVIVTGYSIQKKTNMTSSIASISSSKTSRKDKRKASTSKSDRYSAAPTAEYSADATYFVSQSHYNKEEAEEYGSFVDNKFILPSDEALSTFSVDVDAASYANMRRYINSGQIPPKDAIRTEELINYFNYNYPQPTGEHPINTITEIAECPWNKENKLVHIGIKAKEIAQDKLPASHLVFLIDVSGSMDDNNKLPYVKQSFKMLVKQLRDIDKISIVTYSSDIQTLLTAVSGSNKATLNNTIDNLYASGGTAGGAAIQTAYKLAKDNFIKNGNNRVILATDGDFNIGLSSNSELEQLIEKERKGGVYLTVLGYGMGNYKDERLQTLAQKGNGNHAYIDNITEAEKVLATEFAGTMFTVAKDVKIQVEFNPAKVQAYRLIGYETRLLNKEDFNDDTKDAGEIGVGHSVTALYEIIPVGVKSKLLGGVDKLKYQKTTQKENVALTDSPEMLTLKIRYKPTDSETSKKIEIPVLNTNMPVDKASDNFRFSAAVAQVGMLLHDSPYKSSANYKLAIELAEKSYGNDKDGNRHEFVKLIKSLSQLKNIE